MDMLFLLISVAIFFLLIIASVIYTYFDIRRLKKEIKLIEAQAEENDKNRETLKQQLFQRLTDYAKLFGIPIYNTKQHRIDPEAAGEIFYSRWSNTNNFIPSSARIVLNDGREENPWVLAHELGHYVELLKTGETTEDGADEYGGKICRSLLTAEEEDLLKISLGVYFGEIKSNKEQKIA